MEETHAHTIVYIMCIWIIIDRIRFRRCTSDSLHEKCAIHTRSFRDGNVDAQSGPKTAYTLCL